jgi:hypothetical protein
MAILIPRNERVSGVCYAQTSQGVELPVVDVTHPSFALDASPAAMEALRERAAAEAAQWQRRPRWVRWLLYPLLARQSVLLQGMRASHGTFLSGMNTYLFKLGPAHLATSFAKRMDRKMAAKASAMEVPTGCRRWPSCWRSRWRRGCAARPRAARCSCSTSPAARRWTTSTR